MGVRETQSAARKAHKRLEAALKSGSTLDAQRLSISLGVLLDKSAMLTRQAADHDAHQALLGDERVETLLNVITMFWRGLKLPLGPAARKLLSKMLKAADGREPIVVDPSLAQEAAHELREHVAAELRAVIEREIFERLAPTIADVRGLPEAIEDREPEPMAPPQRVWKPTLPEARVARANVRKAKSVADQVRARRGYGTSEFS